MPKHDSQLEEQEAACRVGRQPGRDQEHDHRSPGVRRCRLVDAEAEETRHDDPATERDGDVILPAHGFAAAGLRPTRAAAVTALSWSHSTRR